MGETSRLYYRLDVAIDAVAMHRPGYRTTPSPGVLEGGGVGDAAEPESGQMRATTDTPDPEPATDEVPWAPLDRARILDISGTGVQLQARSAELAVGDRVILAFPFGGQHYRFETEVMWARRSQFGAGTRVGLRFEGISERDRDALVREIYRAQRGAGKLRRR